MLKKIALFYLRSLDASIRLIGCYLVVALIYSALIGILNGLNWLLFGSFSMGPLHLWIGLILTPPILLLGVNVGGFSIPSFLNREENEKTGPENEALDA